MVADGATLATTEASKSALLRDSDALYEVVNGEMVELAPMGAHEVWLASFLSIRLGGFAQLQNLGYVVVEMLFELGAGLQRRPDVAMSRTSDGREDAAFPAPTPGPWCRSWLWK
jgi:hypothetical protein